MLNLERSEHEIGWSLAEPVSLDQVASWAGRRLASIAPAPAGLSTDKTMLLDAAGKATLKPLAWTFTGLIGLLNLRYILPFNFDALLVTGIALYLLWLPLGAKESD